MGNATQYTLQLLALLDKEKSEKDILGDVKGIENKLKKTPLRIPVSIDESKLSKDMAKVFKDIQSKAAEFGKISVGTTTVERSSGLTTFIDQRSVNWMDQYHNTYRAIVTESKTYNEKMELVSSNIKQQNVLLQDSAAYQKKLTAEKEKQEKEEQKILLTMEKQQLNAQKFLEKVKTLNQMKPNVREAMSVAQQIVGEKDPQRVQELSNRLAVLKSGITSLSSANLSFSEGMQRAITTIGEYALSTGVLYAAMNQLRQGMQYVIDLNKEMTKIQVLQIPGAQSKEEINALAKEYNQLAKEMGVTTIEVSKGSVEWLRQGKSIDETKELLKSTLMLSKLGALESAEATEYLTSTLNGFKMGAEESSKVVDALIILDNNYATSAGEISSALQRSANSAQQAGISFNELTSYITVVSSTTRKSAESIGESFKTMFARMEAIKLGKMFEDDATNINDVEKALSLVDIQIRDSKNSFRPMGDVLDDIAAKWETMSETERSAVSSAIAGVRQRENFIALMENYNEVLKAQKLQLEAAGIAQKNYDVYLSNTEAAQNKLTAAWEGFWQSQEITESITIVYNGLASVLDVMTKYGPMLYNLQKWFMPILSSLEIMKNSLKSVADAFEKLGDIKIPFLGNVTFGFAAEGLMDKITGADKKKASEEYDKMEIARMQQWQKSAEKATQAAKEQKSAVEGLEEDWRGVSEESKKAFETVIDMTVKMIKQKKEAQKDALKDEIDNLKKVFDLQKQAYKDQYDEEKRIREESEISLKYRLEDIKAEIKARKDAAEREYKEITRLNDAKKDALENELDAYNNLIDKQIELLNEKKKEADFQRDLKDKTDELAKIQSQIIELSLDDSAEARAKRLELEEKASETQKEIDDDIYNNQIDKQISALEVQKKTYQEEYELKIKSLEASQEAAKVEYELRIEGMEQEEANAERRFELQQRDLDEAQRVSDLKYEMNIRLLENEYNSKKENLDRQINLIDNYLEQEGTIRRDALRMLSSDTDRTYQELISWNRIYGSGINETVTNAWKTAKAALDDYIGELNKIPNERPSISAHVSGGIKQSPSSTGGASGVNQNWNSIANHHTGLDSGPVGNVRLNNNEEIIKALKGEILLNSSDMDRLMNKVFPSLLTSRPEVSGMGAGNITIEMPINVAGNLDKTVIPDLQALTNKVIERLNQNVFNRGHIRSTSTVSI